MSSVNVGEYESEPIPGLPGYLPEGERILWQGSPCWRGVARRVFHIRKVAVYFGLLLAWRAGTAVADGLAAGEVVAAVVPLTGLSLLTLGLLAGLAWGNARAAIYTITSERVVMRIGVALTMAINLPFRAIQAASVRRFRDGEGDIPLSVCDVEQIGYAMLWPHARPWRLGARAEPMLRSVADVDHVAELLADALSAGGAPAASRLTPERAAAPEVARPAAVAHAAAGAR